MADSKNPIAQRNLEMFVEKDEEQKPWFNNQEPRRGKRRGDIYSSAQLAKIGSLKLEPVGMNLCKPAIDTWVADLLSDKSGIAVQARREGNERIAYFHQVVIDAFMEMQRWTTSKEIILQEMLGEGIGIAHIDRADNIFGCRVRPCSYTKLRWSAHPDDLFWEDLDNIIRIEIMTAKQVITKYGKPLDPKWLAQSGMFETSTAYNKIFITDKGSYQLKQRRNKEECEVAVLESSDIQSFDYEKLLFYNEDKSEITDTYEIPVMGSKEQKEYGDDLMRNAYSYFYVQQGEDKAISLVTALNKNRDRAIKPLRRKQVVKSISAGGGDIGTEILPSNRLNYVPFINELIGYPEGELRHIIPIQDSLNQTELLLMQNGRLLSNPVVFTFGDSVDPKEYAKARSTPGGGIVKVKVKGLSDPQTMKPIVERTDAIGAHYAGMISLFMSQSEYVSGAYSSFQGNSNNALETNSTTQTLNNRAYLKMLPRAKRMQWSQVLTFGVARDFIAKFAEMDTMIRLREVSDEVLDNFAISKPEEGQPFMARRMDKSAYKLEMPMNKPGYFGGKKMVINDFKSTADLVEYTVTAAVDTHNTRERTAIDIREFIKQSGNPNIAAIGMKFLGMLESNPILRQMVKELDIVTQLQQSLTSTQEQLKLEQSLRAAADKKTATARTSEQTAKFSSALANKGNKLLNDFTLLYDQLVQMTKSGEDPDEIASQINQIKPEVEKVIAELKESLDESAANAEEELNTAAQGADQNS
jgi:hypothetical protein